MMTYRAMLMLKAAAIGLTTAAAAAAAVPSAAMAQGQSLSLPPMPLDEALRRIADWSGRPLNIDPDAVNAEVSLRGQLLRGTTAFQAAEV